MSFVSALEALEVGSRVSNEDTSGGSRKAKAQAMPGSGSMDVSGFWEQRTRDQAQGSAGDFFWLICVLVKPGFIGALI